MTEMKDHVNDELMATERQNRLEALNNAARHRLASEDAEAVVKNAKAYFEFLQGEAKA